MRIISGEYRGRKLEVPPRSRMRPTTDRVREAMFSILGRHIDGAEVLDLCCGCGSLGLESLSRGAAMVHFVDIDPTALGAVKRNLEICGVSKDRSRIHRNDALAWLNKWRTWRRTEPGLVVLADPPYEFGLAKSILETLSGLSPDAGLLMGLVEHETTLDVSGIEGVRKRAYGRCAVSVVEVDDGS